MKKFLKILGIIVGIILLLLVIAGVTINVRGIPSYETQEIKLKVEMDSTSIDNGERLSAMLCSACHRGKNIVLLEGREMDLDPKFGNVWSANITKHPEKGLGKYTDGEIVYLLRTGVKRDGQYAPPWMSKFPHMADDDMEDIIAFMRSDHPSLQASEAAQPASQPSFLVKALCNLVFKPYPMPENKIEIPDSNDRVAFGKYIANDVIQCFDCHSADFTTNNTYSPEISQGFYGGGNKMPDIDGNDIYSANITMDKNTGIGNWTEDEFVKAVRFGSRPDGSPIMYPMDKFSLLTDDEVKAIFAYLKTIPVIENDIKALVAQ